MKAVCIVLLCLATIAYAYFDEELEMEVGRRAEKKLPGGYTFITKSIGNGKYDCQCLRGGRKVWSGMCGVKDKKFSYSDCV